MGASQFKDERDIVNDYYVTIPITKKLENEEPLNPEVKNYPIYFILNS
jgi:hypothetical protein